MGNHWDTRPSWITYLLHMTESVYPHKRGATLSLAGTVTLPAGSWSATAQVRNASGSLVQQLAVTLQAPVAPATAHGILIEATADQAATWPLSDLRCDVRFADASATPVVVPSPTFIVRVQQEVTHAVV